MFLYTIQVELKSIRLKYFLLNNTYHIFQNTNLDLVLRYEAFPAKTTNESNFLRLIFVLTKHSLFIVLSIRAHNSMFCEQCHHTPAVATC